MSIMYHYVQEYNNRYKNFSFLPDYNSIEIDIIYDILNGLSDKELKNINIYLFKQWILTKRLLELKEAGTVKRKREILKLTYDNTEFTTKEKLNNMSENTEELKRIANAIEEITAVSIINMLSSFFFTFEIIMIQV